MGRNSRVQCNVDGKSGRRWKAERQTLKWFRCVENDFENGGLDDGRTKAPGREEK